MASIYGEKRQGWQARLDYSTKQSISGNSSEIVAKLYIYVPSSGVGSHNDNTSEAAAAYHTIQGGSRVYKKYRYDTSGWKYIGTRTFTVAHDSDGTKSVNLYAEWVSRNATAYTPGSLPVSKTVTLPRIPRASSVSVPYFTIGTGAKISINRASTSFTHTLAYQLIDGQVHTIDTGIEVSRTWTPPRELLAELPTNNWRNVDIICTTFQGKTKIGETRTRTRLYVPSSVKPSIQSVTVSPSNSNSWLAGQGIFVRYFTRAHVVTKATAGEGSSIASVKISGIGTGAGSDWTSDFLAPGDRTVTVTVTDRRGRSATMTKSIYVWDYASPRVSNYSLRRGNEFGKPDPAGDRLLVKAAARYTSLSSRNKVTVEVRTAPKGGSFGAWKAIPNSMDSVTTLTGFSPLSTYTIEIRAKDLLGQAKTRRFTLATEEVCFEARTGGRGFAFGKHSEKTGLEVGWDAEFYKDVRIGGKSALGLIRALTSWTDLTVKPPKMEPGWTLGATGVKAQLVSGSILRLDISVKSSTTIQPGDFVNKKIARIVIRHEGRIKYFSFASGIPGWNGGLAGFVTDNLFDDGVDLAFDFTMTSLAHAGSEWNCFLLIPVTIDPAAYLV